MDEKKKQYTSHDVKRADRARKFQNISDQPVKQILHAVDNNILQNLPIPGEDFGMAEEIYGPRMPHLKGKTVHHKVQHVETIIVSNKPKGILDRHMNFTLCCDLMNINGIRLLNNISRHILFDTGSIIKN